MKIQDMRIGQTVKIVSNYIYPEWQGATVTVIGLSIERGEDITIQDSDGLSYDEFKAVDFE